MCPKDKVFVKIDNETGKKKTSIINEKTPLNTRFVEKCKMSTGRPFIALMVLFRYYRQIFPIFDSWVSQQPIQNIVLFVDLFTSVICTYPMKRCSLQLRKRVKEEGTLAPVLLLLIIFIQDKFLRK